MARIVAIACLALTFTSGCAALRKQVCDFHADPFSTATRSIVYVVDGAGNFQGTSQNLRAAVRAENAPVCVRTVEWQHGVYHILVDHVDNFRFRRAGKELAERVMQTRAEVGPDVPIHIVGQSAGCAVVLEAMKALPCQMVDRVFLLAPTVCADYDLRPALPCARQVDVYYSPEDTFILGVLTNMFGTSDRCWLSPPAGRVGFRIPDDPAAAADYCNLRQHCWHPEMKKVGYAGGHFGVNQASFLRTYVLPELY
ncbi:MAG: hypothetical protein KatS3mg105_3778 [Gemmatales bacterium]|nr:MAG: hypothetical protein KatS3mg105_3778 [Gemmatales bacterium]